MAEVKKPVAVAKKVEVKKEEATTVAAPVKAEAKKTVAPVKAEAKKAVAPKKAEAKAPAKKAATAKKTAAPKKTTKKVETKASLFVQFQGRDYAEETLIKMAKDAYKKSGNKDALKSINVYANVDDQVAYYVANGSIEGKFEI